MDQQPNLSQQIHTVQHTTGKEEVILPLFKANFSDVVGRPLFYPGNEFAFKIAKLMKRETFTKKEILLLKEMGFPVELGVRQPVLPDELA